MHVLHFLPPFYTMLTFWNVSSRCATWTHILKCHRSHRNTCHTLLHRAGQQPVMLTQFLLSPERRPDLLSIPLFRFISDFQQPQSFVSHISNIFLSLPLSTSIPFDSHLIQAYPLQLNSLHHHLSTSTFASFILSWALPYHTHLFCTLYSSSPPHIHNLFSNYFLFSSKIIYLKSQLFLTSQMLPIVRLPPFSVFISGFQHLLFFCTLVASKKLSLRRVCFLKVSTDSVTTGFSSSSRSDSICGMILCTKSCAHPKPKNIKMSWCHDLCI